MNILGAIADSVMPKTNAWLHRQVRAHIGEILRRHEGGMSFMDYFIRTDRAPDVIAASFIRHLGDDLAKFFQPERPGDLTISVHFYEPPAPLISVGVKLIEGDHRYPEVYVRVSLDMVPEYIELPPVTADNSPKIPADRDYVAPPLEPLKQQKHESKQPAGKPVPGRRTK